MTVEAGPAAGAPPPGAPTPTPTVVSDPAPVVDRRAALAAGAPKMPRRVIYWAVAAVLGLGLGGTLVDRLVTTSGTPARAAPRPPAAGATVSGTATPATTTPLPASLPAFLGLTSLAGHRATGFSLADAATGATVSLAGLRGHVVVLTFANAACNDICPVLAAELDQAAALVGTTPVPVTFVTINTDPLDLRGPGHAPILTATALPTLPDWRFLSGTVAQLDPVWAAYGISITADRATGAVSHNDLLYFIGRHGALAWTATPFADESHGGTYSLPAAEVTRFAQGIAHYADRLAASP